MTSEVATKMDSREDVLLSALVKGLFRPQQILVYGETMREAVKLWDELYTVASGMGIPVDRMNIYRMMWLPNGTRISLIAGGMVEHLYGSAVDMLVTTTQEVDPEIVQHVVRGGGYIMQVVDDDIHQ